MWGSSPHGGVQVLHQARRPLISATAAQVRGHDDDVDDAAQLASIEPMDIQRPWPAIEELPEGEAICTTFGVARTGASGCPSAAVCPPPHREQRTGRAFRAAACYVVQTRFCRACTLNLSHWQTHALVLRFDHVPACWDSSFVRCSTSGGTSGNLEISGPRKPGR